MSQEDKTIPEGWSLTKIGDTGKVITGKTPSKNNPEDWGDIYDFITPTEIQTDFKYISDCPRKLSHLGYKRFEKMMLPIKSVIVTCIGSDMGKVVMNLKLALANQQINSVVVHKSNSSQFIYYSLKNSYKILRKNAEGSGSTMPILNKSNFQSIKIALPPLQEQKAIANVLTAFDDKIENLRAQNDTLEQTAQTIFTEWFGKYQIGDELPKGWSLRSFYSIGDFINGSAFKSSDFLENRDGLPIIKIAELKNGITESTAFTKKDVDPKYLINDYDILFSWSGSPETSIDIFLWTNDKAILNQHTFNVKIKDKNMKAWYYFLLKYHKPLFIQLAKMKQTTGLGHVTISNLKEYSFIYPNKSLLDSKAPLFTTFFKKIASNRKQIQTLSQTRDTLLPKLMSGQLRVKGFDR